VGAFRKRFRRQEFLGSAAPWAALKLARTCVISSGLARATGGKDEIIE
jgi:hypothetical protein